MAGDFYFFATIGCHTSGFEAAFGKLDKTLGDWGVNLDKMSQKGSSFLKGFGVDTDVLAGKFGLTSAQLGVLATGAMAAAAAVAEVGKALIAVGEQFDKVNETLAKTTGATGGGLAALNTDFQDLLQLGVEQKIPDVAQAFADLNFKLGLSGKPLEDLTKLMSDFADVTNQSVTQAVEGSTDIINKWGLSLSDVPALLDQLTRASQKSGVSTGELSEILSFNPRARAGRDYSTNNLLTQKQIE
jgi:phage-related minor tail protein